jgi:hypothetical protein
MLRESADPLAAQRGRHEAQMKPGMQRLISLEGESWRRIGEALCCKSLSVCAPKTAPHVGAERV